MNDLYLVFKNMVRKKTRLILNMLAIFIAFLIFVFLTALNNTLNAGVDLAAADRLMVVNKVNFTRSLPYAYYERTKAVEGVEAATILNWFGGYYQDPRNFAQTFATDPEALFAVYGADIKLDEDQKQAFISNRQGLMAGRQLAEKYGWTLGQRIPLSSNIFTNIAGGQTWELDLVAIYDATETQGDTSSAYFHYDNYNQSVSIGKDRAGIIAIRTKDPKINEAVIKAIDSQFAGAFEETETVPEKVFGAAFIKQLGDVGLIIHSVVGAAFITILFIVGNSMALAVRERAGEIAVLKTLGFTAGRVFAMLLTESILQPLLAGGLAILAAYFLLGPVNMVLGAQFPPLILTYGLVIEAVALMVFLGVITGFLPAYSAMRMSLLKAFARR